MSMKPEEWIACPAPQDAQLRHTLQFGIGLHHAGLNEADRSAVEALFVGGRIQVPLSPAAAFTAVTSHPPPAWVGVLVNPPCLVSSCEPETFITAVLADRSTSCAVGLSDIMLQAVRC